MDRIAPDSCNDIAEVRHGVDRLDAEIVALLAERFRYMAAAARIKPSRDAVRDEWRKADVLAKVLAAAETTDAPTDQITALYDTLIEASIAYELSVFDARKG